MWFYYTEPKLLRTTKPFSVVSEAYLKEFSNRQPRAQSQIRAGGQFIQVMEGDTPVGAFRSLP